MSLGLESMTSKQLQDMYMNLMYTKSAIPHEKFKHLMRLVLNEMYKRGVQPPKEEDWNPGE